MKKQTIVRISGILLSILVGGGFIYHKMHTNSPEDIRDYTGKYILNPEYKEFHKYEWTDLKSVYPTKLAYDPKWFILPPDKYIPKEQPIPKEISNISDSIIRRQAYFNFLCKNENITYINKSYYENSKINSINSNQDEGLLNLTITLNIPKTMSLNNLEKNLVDEIISIEKSKMIYANNNPFINPNLQEFYYPLIEGHRYNFSGVDLEKNNKSLNTPNKKSRRNQFIELMSPEGKIFKVEFDVITNSFLPAKIITHSSARYYALSRPIERKELKNLGIYGFEHIIYDKKDQKIVNYSKTFNMGSILPWKEPNSISNFSWVKKSYCNSNTKIIENF